MNLMVLNGRVVARPNTEQISFRLYWRNTPIAQAEMDRWAADLGFVKTPAGEMTHRDGRRGMMWPEVRRGEVVFEAMPAQAGLFSAHPFPSWFFGFARTFFKGCPFSHTLAGIPLNAGLMQSEEEFQRREAGLQTA